MKIKTVETNREFSITLRKPSLRYLEEFIRLKCSPDLLIAKVFPNAKEITESMGAYNAYRTNFMDSILSDDENVNCLVIGDGCMPRTGALFAMRTKWNVTSIDPRLRDKSYRIDRLSMIRERAEEVDYSFVRGSKHILVVCVHSHANLDKTIQKIKQDTNTILYIISIPCCKEDNLHDKYNSYPDYGIMSEKRVVNVYYYSR